MHQITTPEKEKDSLADESLQEQTSNLSKMNSNTTTFQLQQKRTTYVDYLNAIAVGSLRCDEAKSSFANLFDLSEADERQQKLQQYAVTLRDRFSQADWVDAICGFYGWRLTGLGWLDLDISDWQIDYGSSLDWCNVDCPDHLIRMELADDPILLASDDGGGDWRVIDLQNLPDELCDCIAKGRA